MATWEDATSYSRGERRGKVPPRVWTLDTGKISISVHRIHALGTECWFLSCNKIRLKEYQLKSEALDEAQAEAFAIVQSELVDIVASLEASS
jgi:hypothetical protein